MLTRRQLLGATLAALSPVFPRVALDPGIFFLCFVPPLLFADGWLMPLRDFMEAKRPVLLLATGLVVFTTVSVGLVSYWLVPGLPLAMAFALGAVVSPADAVVVGAITQRLKVPTRLSAVGVPASAIPRLAASAMKVTRLLKNNPRELTLADAEEIYRRAL